MLRLNIGSGMLRLSSCMLSIGLEPKCEQGGAVGSKSYLMVAEIHRATIIGTLTSPAAANQLAAGAFFWGE